MKTRSLLRIQVALGFVLPVICQMTGLFSSYWRVEDGKHQGLFYQCFSNNTCNTQSGVLDQWTLGLQVSSFVILLFVGITSIISMLAYGPDEYDYINNEYATCVSCSRLCFYFWLILYPVAGVLNLSGCIKFATLYHTEVLGLGFYLCVISGCLLFLMIFVFGFDQCCKRKIDDGVFETLLVNIFKKDSFEVNGAESCSGDLECTWRQGSEWSRGNVDWGD